MAKSNANSIQETISEISSLAGQKEVSKKTVAILPSMPHLMDWTEKCLGKRRNDGTISGLEVYMSCYLWFAIL